MISSFKAFMNEIIDYAGLFPPADLSLDTSIHNYHTYRSDDDAWMLSRFIIPASRLAELAPYQDTLFKEGTPFDFSVLGKGTETVSEYRQQLNDLIQQIEQFHETQAPHVTTDILEMKLPKEAVFASDPKLLNDIFTETANRFNASSNLPSQIFLEGFFEENWEKEIGLILEVLSEHNQDLEAQNIQKMGFKLRCGGVKAHMFPSVEQVAFALTGARNHEIPMKCTAGLHHPIRHYADSVQTKMHGFLNVFGGAMLAYAHDLSPDQLAGILRDEDPEHFRFTEQDFRWKDVSISTDEITKLRNEAMISFGSCSFDEPREDLEQLGLL
jgi:hypothetical protein